MQAKTLSIYKAHRLSANWRQKTEFKNYKKSKKIKSHSCPMSKLGLQWSNPHLFQLFLVFLFLM